MGLKKLDQLVFAGKRCKKGAESKPKQRRSGQWKQINTSGLNNLPLFINHVFFMDPSWFGPTCLSSAGLIKWKASAGLWTSPGPTLKCRLRFLPLPVKLTVAMGQPNSHFDATLLWMSYTSWWRVVVMVLGWGDGGGVISWQPRPPWYLLPWKIRAPALRGSTDLGLWFLIRALQSARLRFTLWCSPGVSSLCRPWRWHTFGPTPVSHSWFWDVSAAFVFTAAPERNEFSLSSHGGTW